MAYTNAACESHKNLKNLDQEVLVVGEQVGNCQGQNSNCDEKIQ